MVDGYAWLRPDKPQIEEPHHERPEYDYSGPPFLFNAPPELLKNPLIANDPSMMRLFVKTNERRGGFVRNIHLRRVKA